MITLGLYAIGGGLVAIALEAHRGALALFGIAAVLVWRAAS